MTINTPQDLIPALQQHLKQLHANHYTLNLPLNIPMNTPNSNPVRLSAAGKCPRKLAYQKHHPEKGEELSARSISVFLLGDVLHDLERHFLKQIVTLEDIEEKVFADLPTMTDDPPGHIDGKITIPSGEYILDIKTCSERSYYSMLKEGTSNQYADQLNAYMHATGIHQAILWLYNKNTSHREIIEHEYEPARIPEISKRFTAVQNSTSDELPLKMYDPIAEIRKGEPTGREYLPWQCTYCPFTSPCWGPDGFNMIIERGKPRWIREPKEEEA